MKYQIIEIRLQKMEWPISVIFLETIPLNMVFLGEYHLNTSAWPTGKQNEVHCATHDSTDVVCKNKKNMVGRRLSN